jgi:hypothetical protein
MAVAAQARGVRRFLKESPVPERWQGVAGGQLWGVEGHCDAVDQRRRQRIGAALGVAKPIVGFIRHIS